MDAAVLTPTPTVPALPHWLRPYALGYAALIGAIAVIAAAVAALEPVRTIAQTTIPFNWHVAPHDPNARNLDTALSLWFHNARLTLAPLALAVAIQSHPGRLRRTGDVILAMIFAADILPFSIDLGTWGGQLLPYVPNAPVELMAVAAGPVSWWLVTRGRMPVRALLPVAGVLVLLLLVAACLETWAVA